MIAHPIRYPMPDPNRGRIPRPVPTRPDPSTTQIALTTHLRTVPATSAVHCERKRLMTHAPDGAILPITDRCPRRQCRGRLPHSWLVHWFGWVRR